jgi:hypothetical protein
MQISKVSASFRQGMSIDSSRVYSPLGLAFSAIYLFHSRSRSTILDFPVSLLKILVVNKTSQNLIKVFQVFGNGNF